MLGRRTTLLLSLLEIKYVLKEMCLDAKLKREEMF